MTAELVFTPIINTPLMPLMWICAGVSGCGAVVANKGNHESFHADVDPRFKG